MNVEIKDNTCICHKLNNLIKRMLMDYFEDSYSYYYSYSYSYYYYYFYYYFYYLLYRISDPKKDNKQLHVVADDLSESISVLWDNLPIDTVIASILDPRTKFFDRIPKNEINEAIKIMAKVFIISFKIMIKLKK